MIPVLIVPVLNRYDLLDKMLRSIDHSIDHLVVIDNGGDYGSYDPGDHVRLYARWDRVHEASVVQLPHNIGVAASWNLGMKLTPDGWWLIANSDLEFGPGDLEVLEGQVDPDRAAIYSMLGMAAFALTLPAVRQVGYFDENFHPAYDEDLDYARRAQLAAVPTIKARWTGKHVGSATIFSDPEYAARNRETHRQNDQYYERKWGGHKQGGERFDTPFNRAPSVRAWELDPDRIASQAWPRSTLRTGVRSG